MIGNAVRVMQIATGEAEEEYIDDGKDPAAKALGKIVAAMDAVAPKPGGPATYKKRYSN